MNLSDNVIDASSNTTSSVASNSTSSYSNSTNSSLNSNTLDDGYDQFGDEGYSSNTTSNMVYQNTSKTDATTGSNIADRLQALPESELGLTNILNILLIVVGVLLILLAILGVPVLLIIKQPDYGTAIAFIMALIFMLFVAGIDKKYIIIAIAVVIVAVPLLYFFILPEHAKTRIDVFLNPNLDPRGAGYNVIQSKLAIGAGEFLGMGLLKGNQTQLGFLYPKTTDFIFAVIGEEMGFIIAATVIITYVVLITRSIFIAKTAKNNLGSYIAIGIAGIFLFHMAENIGMTMGLLPITGVPLPFVSYGGSSLLTNLMMIGLLLNISGRRQKAIFID